MAMPNHCASQSQDAEIQETSKNHNKNRSQGVHKCIIWIACWWVFTPDMWKVCTVVQLGSYLPPIIIEVQEIEIQNICETITTSGTNAEKTETKNHLLGTWNIHWNKCLFQLDDGNPKSLHQKLLGNHHFHPFKTGLFGVPGPCWSCSSQAWTKTKVVGCGPTYWAWHFFSMAMAANPPKLPYLLQTNHLI